MFFKKYYACEDWIKLWMFLKKKVKIINWKSKAYFLDTIFISTISYEIEKETTIERKQNIWFQIITWLWY
jgi:hypothetical protein